MNPEDACSAADPNGPAAGAGVAEPPALELGNGANPPPGATPPTGRLVVTGGAEGTEFGSTGAGGTAGTGTCGTTGSAARLGSDAHAFAENATDAATIPVVVRARRVR